MEIILNKIYYDPASPASFAGVNAVYRAARAIEPSIRQSDVKEWLEKQYTYSLHISAPKKFNRNKIFSRGLNDQFQIDLADMQSLAQFNDGYKYLFNCICVFSRYAWSIPVTNKTGKEMVRAFKIAISERKPNRVQSDEGMEFQNHTFQKLLEENNIKFFTSKNRVIKAALVERFNRTIKGKIWKYFTYKRSYRYVDVLPELVSGYNKSYHRTIKMAPDSVTRTNEKALMAKLYGRNYGGHKFLFNLGDKVRVSKVKGTFEKGYLPNWSEEIFTISERLGRKPVMYRLKDYSGESIDGLWYEKELQKSVSEIYWIEKVIRKRNNQALVKWFGYPEKFNSWIPIRDIEQYG